MLTGLSGNQDAAAPQTSSPILTDDISLCDSLSFFKDSFLED